MKISQNLAEIRELLRSISLEEISESAAERLARCWELVTEIQEELDQPTGTPPQVPMASAPPPPPIEISRKAGPIVAIVDDDPDVQRMLSFVLKRKGFSVHGFFDPKIALTQVVDVHPDVIILDLMMPQMTGFEFLEQFKTLRKQLPGVRVIVGSARSFDSDRLAVLKAGANDFVAKPYNLDELVLRIHNLMAA